MKDISLLVLPERLAICQLSPDEPIPDLIFQSQFWSITHTDEELSIVLPEEIVPEDWKAEKGWLCLKVLGYLDFGFPGILSSISTSLADAGVGILVISTYNTDYLLVKEGDIEKAKKVLETSGYEVK